MQNGCNGQTDSGWRAVFLSGMKSVVELAFYLVVPVSVVLYASLLALSFPAIASAFVGDYSRIPLTGWEARYAGLMDVAVSIPLFLFWTGLLALYGWSTGSLLFPLGFSLTAVLLIGLFWHPGARWNLVACLVLVQLVFLAGTGFSAVKALRVGCDRAKRSATLGNALAALTLSYGWIAFRYIAGKTNPSDSMVFIALPFASGAVASLLPSWTLGYVFPLLFRGSREFRSRTAFAIALVPFLLMGVSICRVNTLAKNTNHFKQHALPDLVHFLDTSVASFEVPADVRTKLVGRERAKVEYFNLYTDTEQVGHDLEVELPLNWQKGQGFRTLRIKALVYSLRIDRQGRVPPPQEALLIPDRLALYEFLERLGTATPIRKAAWHLAPRTEWRDPVTHAAGPEYCTWSATAVVGGVTTKLVATPGWKFFVQKFP